eukprot:TRINITY_DN111268_c0_g1_i1.p1 TRINITY_DN111268_c0_g1~~TRINITY_DN111268_c0_g1_i1.p1  ORF type:complete len:543 (-),score=125.32 TRINITY_DN111268_c0_g1_i1:51-1679(-)
MAADGPGSAMAAEGDVLDALVADPAPGIQGLPPDAVQANASAAGAASAAAADPDAGSAVRLPFEPPEQVKKWLRPQDWEALTKAWEDAEAQAFAWAEDPSPMAGMDEALWQDASSLHDSSLLTAGNSIMTQGSGSSTRRRKKNMTPWREDFVAKTDANRPPPLRRYFDQLPAETSMPRQPLRPEIAKLHGPNRIKPDIWSIWHPTNVPDISEATARRLARSTEGNEEVAREMREEGWCDVWHLSVSVDNDRLNPLNRHYFDRRGLESSYRQRPKIDAITAKQRPNSPGPCMPRPTTREKILGRLRSEPSLPKAKAGVVEASKRGDGDITWGRRCLEFGPDTQTKLGIDGSRIPWVNDHNRMESDDNYILNPLLRHYFEREGLESSFRMRGRHYGRPLKVGLGIPPISTDIAPSVPSSSPPLSESGLGGSGSYMMSGRASSVGSSLGLGSGSCTPSGASLSGVEVNYPTWSHQQPVQGRLRQMLMKAKATYTPPPEEALLPLEGMEGSEQLPPDGTLENLDGPGALPAEGTLGGMDEQVPVPA